MFVLFLSLPFTPPSKREKGNNIEQTVLKAKHRIMPSQYENITEKNEALEMDTHSNQCQCIFSPLAECDGKFNVICLSMGFPIYYEPYTIIVLPSFERTLIDVSHCVWRTVFQPMHFICDIILSIRTKHTHKHTRNHFRRYWSTSEQNSIEFSRHRKIIESFSIIQCFNLSFAKCTSTFIYTQNAPHFMRQ